MMTMRYFPLSPSQLSQSEMNEYLRGDWSCMAKCWSLQGQLSRFSQALFSKRNFPKTERTWNFVLHTNRDEDKGKRQI